MNINYYTKKSLIPSWLKWVMLIIIIILVICLIYGIYLYNNIQKSKQAGYPETEKLVLQETDIKSIDNITHFYGEETFHVVYGQTEQNQKKIAFVPKTNKDEKMTVLNRNETMSENDIKSYWRNECNDCELIKVVPAMINKDPLWEITYRDETNRYVIDYLSLYDGERYEQYNFRETFK